MILDPKPHNSITGTLESARTTRQLAFPQGASFAGLGNRESRGQGYCIPPPDALWKGVLHPRMIVSVVQEMYAAQEFQWLPLLLSPEPEPQISVAPQVTLVCFTLPPPQLRVQRDSFALALSESTCVSNRFLSLLDGQNARCFSQPDVIWVPLPGSGALC